MKVPFRKNKYALIRTLTVPALLGLAACDSSTLGNIDETLSNGGEVDVNLSTNDDGDLVISTDTSGDADTPSSPPAPDADAVAVQFTFENLQEDDGFFFTEPWVGLHGGDFDLFNNGERVTPGLESLAEGGNTELLGSEFAQAGRLQTTVGNGDVQWISPGEVVEGSIDIRNAAVYRYASIASMIIPSNDGFFGNEDPVAYEVFDADGNPTGDIEIIITGADLYDAGTEDNNGEGAAGFSLTNPLGEPTNGGLSIDDPTGVAGAHPGFDNLVGIQTAAGTTVGSNGSGGIDLSEPVARITISVGASINTVQAVAPLFDGSTVASPVVGAVFAMTNGVGQPAAGENVAGPNAVVSYSRAEDGTLTLVGSFPTGDLGGDFDGGEGLDPLISANAVELTPDNSIVLAVNAGSNSLSSFLVNDDMSLTLVSTVASGGTGPNSVATDGERVYVTNIDADGIFGGEPDQVGNVTSFLLSESGELTSTGSSYALENRPSNIRLSSDDNYIVISSLTAGSVGLPNDSIINENTAEDGPDEIVVHPVTENGIIQARSGSAISSFRAVRSNNDAAFFGPDEPIGNDPVATDVGEGRNLPSPIGIIVAASTTANIDTVVVSETREFSAFGAPPTLPNLEAGSLSTFSLDLSDGSIVSTTPDVLAMLPGDPNQLTLCWVVAVPMPDGSMVAYVSNTINSLISSFEIGGDGSVSLIESIAAAGDGPFPAGTDNTDLDPANGPLGEQVFGNTDGYIDMALSDDNDYLYQLTGLTGTIEVYARNDDNTLTLVQSVDEETDAGEGALPTLNTQGIVAF